MLFLAFEPMPNRASFVLTRMTGNRAPWGLPSTKSARNTSTEPFRTSHADRLVQEKIATRGGQRYRFKRPHVT